MRLGRRLSSGIAEDPPAPAPAEPVAAEAPAEKITAEVTAESREHAAQLADR